MHLFTDYIEPLTSWLRTHPDWALFIAFIISFSESLAIIGSIVPGSVTMTAIGILAGSGVMRVDLTLLFASFGAILGDAASYTLGYVLSEKLTNTWPFNRYPHWLDYGKDFFERHGGKSVLLGRFVGPLRSVIPVIAGMMHMRKLAFMLANISSGFAWSIVYILPGILIGAASIQLSAEQATRLFIFVLLMLILIWLSSRIVRWGIQRSQVFFESMVSKTWALSRNSPRLSPLVQYITPAHERNHEKTAALLILCCLSLICTFMLMYGVTDEFNAPIYFFLQSIRTKAFDTFFTPIMLIISAYPLITFAFCTTLSLISKRDHRTFLYLTSLNATLLWVTYVLNQHLSLFITTDDLLNQPHPTFIHFELAFATANFIFCSLLTQTLQKNKYSYAIQITLRVLLLLNGFAHLYLGDNLFTSILASYSIGLGLCCFHWLFYRRKKINKLSLKLPFVMFSCVVIAVILFNFKTTQRIYRPNTQQYILSNRAWWNQEKPLLPLYTTNRIGRPIGLFNIQYLGSIHRFEQTLKSHGWKKQTDSFLEKLLIQTDKKARKIRGSSFKTELYQSQKPDLIMTYTSKKNEPQWVIRLWESNYHLLHHTQPLWIGSIQPYSYGALDHLISALDTFEINTLPVPPDAFEEIPSPSNSTLLMVREVR